MGKYSKLSFVIPAYNESNTIRDLLAKVQELKIPFKKEIIVIDDGSKDDTREILQSYAKYPEFKILFNEKNMGKSQTVRKGIVASTGDLVVIQDADLEYDPQDLIKFINLFISTDVDIVYGNRFGRNNKVVYWQNWIGNSLLSLISGTITGLRSGMWTRDMETCYKMVKGDIFREVGKTIVSKSTFGLEPEITAKLARYKLNGKHLKFKQVAVHYFPRTIAEGKKMHAFRDGFKALIEILRFNILG